MRIFFSYIYKIKFWIIIFIVQTALMSGIMFLNGVPGPEIIYGICLVVFIVLTAIVYGGYKYYNDYRYLKIIEKNIGISINRLPDPEDCIEEEYQQLIKNLSDSFNAELNKNARTLRDIEEYYTLWIHQIKTPIAAMKVLLQEKTGGIDVSYEQAQLFNIEQYADMALQYMRLGSETTDFLIKKVNVHKITKEAVHKYARMFINKKIKLDFQDFNILVVSDEKWLGFVIGQILSNAVKYTHKGYVSIYMETGLYRNKDGIAEAALVIQDTGIGINSADLPRICEKGYTGYNGHEDKISTGIGLYLCSKTLKKLSHRMEISSEEGKGTKVKILFNMEE